MRYYVIKELTNNLYLGRHLITGALCDANFYKNFDLCLKHSEDDSMINSFLFYVLEKNFNTDRWHLDISQETYDEEKAKLNIRVIPVEIHEGTYYE